MELCFDPAESEYSLYIVFNVRIVTDTNLVEIEPFLNRVLPRSRFGLCIYDDEDEDNSTSNEVYIEMSRADLSNANLLLDVGERAVEMILSSASFSRDCVSRVYDMEEL